MRGKVQSKKTGKGLARHQVTIKKYTKNAETLGQNHKIKHGHKGL